MRSISVSGGDVTDKGNKRVFAKYSPSRIIDFQVSDPDELAYGYRIIVDATNGLKGAVVDIGTPPDEAEIFLKYDLSFKSLPKGESELFVTFADDRFGLYGAPANFGWTVTKTSLLIVTLKLDKKLQNIEIRESQPIEVAIGATETKREEFTTSHSVEVTDNQKINGGLQASIDLVKIGIHASVEKSTKNRFATSSTSTREVKLVGNGRKYKLIWIKHYQTGVCTTIVDGTAFTVPFKMCVGWDLQAREVK